jgi:hypothetical protein
VVSQETRENLRQRALERGSGNYKASKESREKLSQMRRGKKRNVTEKWLKAAREKGDKQKGSTLPEETKQKISESLKGRVVTEEHRENLSKALKGKYIGENSSGWKGGVSNDPYPLEFDRNLKRKIRRRDNQTCQTCFRDAKGLKGCVHHRDGDKQNCTMDNLILVCIVCHGQIHATKDTDNEMILKFRSELT